MGYYVFELVVPNGDIIERYFAMVSSDIEFTSLRENT